MRDNFKQVMDWIGISEGGYVNHPRDPAAPRIAVSRSGPTMPATGMD